MIKDERIENWDQSYLRGENFVFWPCDAVVRFVSRSLRKRVGIDEVIDVLPGARGQRVLDLGCGIGRNLNFGQLMGLEMFGVEHSRVAVEVARRWMRQTNPAADDDRVRVGDVRDLSYWSDGFFDHALSDSVLDSMPFDVAWQGVAEVARLVKPGGYFYLNVIGERNADGSFFDGERTQSSQHEQGTVQSYFDRAKIETLLGRAFAITRLELQTIEGLVGAGTEVRWHVVTKRQ